MEHYKTVENGVIVMIGIGPVTPGSQVAITEEEYRFLQAVMSDKPVDTYESVYFLAESGIYEARERTPDEVIAWYVNVVEIGTISIEDVPEEYREVVRAKLPEPTPKLYTLDEASEIIAKEVSEYVG